MAKYFVIRVSAKDQNFARQLEVAKQYGIPEENIFKDKITGRKKERPEYDRLKSIVQAGDEVYFTEIDRIGRAKHLIKEELEWFKEKKVILRILNVPTTLMDFPEGSEWILDMVNNILIEVLSAMAEQEWERTKKRRDDGIAAMPEDDEGHKYSSRTGRRFGRTKGEIAEDVFKEVYLKQQSGELTLKEAMSKVGIGRTRWYELAREYKGGAKFG